MAEDYSDIKLETKDLILKKAEFKDWRMIYHNVWQHEETAKYMLWKWTENEEEAKERMIRTIEFQKKNKYALLIYLKETGEAIGFAGMRPLENNSYEETGIALGPRFVHKGYGKQVLNALTEEAKKQGAAKFLASNRVKNEASCALQHSCGFTFDFLSEEKTDPRTGEKYFVENNVKIL